MHAGPSDPQNDVMIDQPAASGPDQHALPHMQQSAVSQQLCHQQHANHLVQQVPQIPFDSSNHTLSTGSGSSSSSKQQLQAQGPLLNSLRLLELSKQLQDLAAQVAAAAEVAQQYEFAGDATKAAASYAELLAACTAASAAGHGKEQWLLQLLVQHVPAAVDVHLQLVSLGQAGAGGQTNVPSCCDQ